MSSFANRISELSIGTKISIATFGLVALVFTLYAWTLGYSSSRLAEQNAANGMRLQTQSVIDMIEMVDNAVLEDANRSGKRFASIFPAKFSLDTSRSIDVNGVSTPVLRSGETDLNMDFSSVDTFTSTSGVPATIFVKSGSDFIRVSTSLKKENGDRAIGTVLDHAHPAYALVSAGKSYTGVAKLFGKDYSTNYEPIRDDSGAVIGVLFVGFDITVLMKTLKEKIAAIKVGKAGYFFVVNTKPGNEAGTLIVHPTKTGQKVLETKDADGRLFIKEMLEQGKGTMRYPLASTGQDNVHTTERMAMFDTYPRWNWLVAGSADTKEFTKDVVDLGNRYALFGVIAVVVLVALLYQLMRVAVIRPLLQATDAAQHLAKGDLTVVIDVTRKDEVGALLMAMNGISNGLSNVIVQVRDATGQIGVSSGEIATGNMDLSARTESQASSLEETSSAMEQLASTVRQNADNARQANDLVQLASGIALKGGQAVAGVVQTMGSIKASSSKIVDIISVIDGIAFQTNILALNAAVEAARAGEEGRGFAVVAAEVRSLAQRSAAAAKEIKGLITDSVERVDAGSALVGEAGKDMQAIVASVQKITDIMSDINAASSEQSTGIDHINEAIIQIDGMTQQNAALVEEASAAAVSLQEQARQLGQLVEIFHIDERRYGGSMTATAPEKAASSISTFSPSLKKRPVIAKREIVAMAPRTPPKVKVSGDDWEEF